MDFYELNKLLQKLPFSIVGYSDLEQEIDGFFEELCDSKFIHLNDNIKLVSYSYAKLKGDNLFDWDTASLSDTFFFHSLNEKYSLLAMNMYYGFRNHLFGYNQKNEDDEESKESNDGHLTNNVAIVLSRLFLQDVGFRISYSFDDNWHFGFLEHKNVFSIKIPFVQLIKDAKNNEDAANRLQEAISKYLKDVIKSFEEDSDDNKFLIKKAKDHRSTYKKNKTEKYIVDKPFKEFIKIFKDKEELESLRNEMISAIHFWHKSNPGFFNPTDIENNLKNWVELFFQILLVSFVYDCWVEYFPAVCGVVERENNVFEKRNLGGLIVGYSVKDTIDLQLRSLFRLISSRISSAISSEWLYSENIQFLRRKRQFEFGKAIKAIISLEDNEQLHAGAVLSNDFKSRFINTFNIYKNVLTDRFLESFNTQLTNHNKISKYCLFQITDADNECNHLTVNQPRFKKINEENQFCCGNHILNPGYYNLPLLSSFYDKFMCNAKKNTFIQSLSLKDDSNNFVVELTYKNNFGTSNFIKEVKKRAIKGGVVGFIFEHFYQLDLHGTFIFQYKSGDSFVDFFNTREWVKKTKISKTNERSFDLYDGYRSISPQGDSNVIRITYVDEINEILIID